MVTLLGLSRGRGLFMPRRFDRAETHCILCEEVTIGQAYKNCDRSSMTDAGIGSQRIVTRHLVYSSVGTQADLVWKSMLVYSSFLRCTVRFERDYNRLLMPYSFDRL